MIDVSIFRKYFWNNQVASSFLYYTRRKKSVSYRETTALYRMAASILQLLLALKFSVIYSWQLLLSEKSLVWRKNSSIYLHDFTDLDFFYINVFFSFFDKYLFILPITESLCCTQSSQPFC